MWSSCRAGCTVAQVRRSRHATLTPRITLSQRNPGESLTARASPHERLELLFESRVPSRQGRTIFDDITRCPENSQLILLAGGLVVLAQNVEVAAGYAFNHPLRHLFRKPCRGRFIRHPSRNGPGEREPRDKQMRGHSAIRKITQGMRQTFG